MKFLLFALVAIGVAQAAVIQPSSMQEAENSRDRIIEIVKSCADDPEVQTIVTYFREVFPAFVEVIRNDTEISALFAGIDFDWLKQLFDISTIDEIEFDRFAPKICGGWRGVYEQVQEEITSNDMIVIIREIYANYPEFAAVRDRIAAAEPTSQSLLNDPTVAAVFERLEGLGMDLQVIRDALNGLFG